MKRILPILLLLCASAFAQEVPPDHAPDRTHKAHHERTPFYEKDGKTRCGIVVETKAGSWRVVTIKQGVSSLFDTRAQAVKYITVLCPVEGRQGHD